MHLQLNEETCLKEARAELAAGTSFDAVSRMISNTTLPEETKEEIKNQVARETL